MNLFINYFQHCQARVTHIYQQVFYLNLNHETYSIVIVAIIHGCFQLDTLATKDGSDKLFGECIECMLVQSVIPKMSSNHSMHIQT